MLQEPPQTQLLAPAPALALRVCSFAMQNGRTEHDREEQRAMMEVNKLASQPEASCMQVE